MSVPIAELKKLDGYIFSLKKYDVSHSTLTLYAGDPEILSGVYVYFFDVQYIQMPISWKASFEIGSDLEREEIVRLTGLPSIGLAGLNLYKTSESKILILGALAAIEQM